MYNSKSLFQKRNYQKCWGVEANCATLQQLAFFADFRALYFCYISFVVFGEIQASLRFLKFEQVCPQKLKSMFWGFFKFSLAYWLKIVFLSHGNDTSNPYLPLHYFPIHSYLCNYLGLFWNVFCSVFVGEKGIKFDEQDRPTSAFFRQWQSAFNCHPKVRIQQTKQGWKGKWEWEWSSKTSKNAIPL